jgi:hypothetical protein
LCDALSLSPTLFSKLQTVKWLNCCVNLDNHNRTSHTICKSWPQTSQEFPACAKCGASRPFEDKHGNPQPVKENQKVLKANGCRSWYCGLAKCQSAKQSEQGMHMCKVCGTNEAARKSCRDILDMCESCLRPTCHVCKTKYSGKQALRIDSRSRYGKWWYCPSNSCQQLLKQHQKEMPAEK